MSLHQLLPLHPISDGGDLYSSQKGKTFLVILSLHFFFKLEREEHVHCYWNGMLRGGGDK